MSDEFAALKLLSPEEQDYVGHQLMGGNTGTHLAPYILGMFLDSLLLGVLIMQYSRWQTYCFSREKLTIRLLVFYVLILNIGITVFLAVWNVMMFAENFGRYRQFISIDFASFFYLIDAMVRFPVSSFFAERAWRASGKSRLLAAILGLLLVASLGLGIAAKAISTTMYGSTTFIVLSCIWLACHLACDLITTSVISIFLYRSKTGWSTTDALLMHLLVLTAETQLPPTVLSTAFLITYVTSPASAWPIFFVFSAKVFGICLIAVLNTKFTLRRGLETSTSGDDNNTYNLKSRTKRSEIQVHVATETFRERDEYELDYERKRAPGNGLAVTVDDQSQSNVDYLKISELKESLPQVRFS